MKNNQRVIAIIEARLNSTRLPNKVLMKINGKTLLRHLIERTFKAKSIDAVVVAVPSSPENLEIVSEVLSTAQDLKKDNLFWFLGPEDDVLTRILRAAEWIGADVIVRITADNPLTCPVEVDKMVKMLAETHADIVHNKSVLDKTKKTLPIGMGAEVMDIWALRKLDALSKGKRYREHVVFYAFENVEQFNIRVLENKNNSIDARLTIDFEDDFLLISEIIKELGEDASTEDIIKFLRDNPSLAESNMSHEDVWRK